VAKFFFDKIIVAKLVLKLFIITITHPILEYMVKIKQALANMDSFEQHDNEGKFTTYVSKNNMKK
jgi:hypothetical protein